MSDQATIARIEALERRLEELLRQLRIAEDNLRRAQQDQLLKSRGG